MKLYPEFNTYIKNKFFPPEKRGTTILFSVDETTIREFQKEAEINKSIFQQTIASELREWWPATIKENFFGLCAIQIFTVSQMQDEEDFTSREYNPRLAQFFDIDTSTLQKQYAEEQDDLWGKLKQYCQQNNFRITLPEATTGKGRYIQYPFSQALLNKQDLKKVSILFERVGLRTSEYLSFEDFSTLIETADNGCMHSRYYKIKRRLQRDYKNTRLLTQQIYNYFIEGWDGLYPAQQTKETNNRIKRQARENYHLYLSRNNEYVTVFNDNFDMIEQIPVARKGLFEQIEKFQSIYDDKKELLICKIDEISREAEYIRTFEIGYQYIIICKQHSEASRNIYFLQPETKNINNFYEICTTGILKEQTIPFWNKYFSGQSRTYKIEGGVKLGYKRWMLGGGPLITFPEQSTAWLNGEKIEQSEIDCTNYPAGIYKLVKDESIEKFEIKVPDHLRKNHCKGWAINRKEKQWQPATEDPQIVGLRTEFPNIQITTTLRTWISGLIREEKKQKPPIK